MRPDLLSRALRSATPPPSDKADGHLDPDTIAAIVDGLAPDRDVVAHLSDCTDCRARVAAVASLLEDPVVAAAILEAQPLHLDDEVIAAIVDGADMNERADAIEHLGECAECRSRVADLAKLMDDPAVVAEIEQLKPSKRATPARWSRSRWVTVTTLAAAASLAIVLLSPQRMGMRSPVTEEVAEAHREGTLTTTAPPRIISPLDDARPTDSLRWSNVTGADLYRVQIWNRDGTVVWSTETRTTSLPMPSQLMAKGGSYLWEVKARTGWDRWVASDFLEFTIRSSSPR